MSFVAGTVKEQELFSVSFEWVGSAMEFVTFQWLLRYQKPCTYDSAICTFTFLLRGN